MNKQVELLSPAGDMECFRAAINAGADAVYLGGNRFNARAYASNLDQKELIEALDIAHLFGRRIYLTLNTLFKDNELTEVYDYIYPLYINGLDGVIIQDPGVAKLLRECFPGLPLHASTQLSVTGAEGIRLLSDSGISRVVPARELSLIELKRMRDETGMELECFIHGALCYSYSGKCLFSSLLGGRSGNRGRCAGPCRLPYKTGKDDKEKYYLSAKDICVIDVLDRLIDAGIYSFKIEGRMKGPEYVAGVTGIYRKYIDRILASDHTEPYRVDKKDRDDLIKLYTRGGNSGGYYFKQNGRDMLSIDSPAYDRTQEGLRKKLYLEYGGKAPKRPVVMRAVIEEEKPSVLELSCEHNGRELRVCVNGETAESAKTRPLGTEEINRQLKKLGNTEFEAISTQTVIKGSPFMTAASLNALRRDGILCLKSTLLSEYKRELEYDREKADGLLIKEQGQVNITSGGNSAAEPETGSFPKLHVSFTDLNLLGAVLMTEGVNAVSFPVSILNSADELKDICKRVREHGKLFIPRLPYIIRNSIFPASSDAVKLLWEYSDGVLIDNIELLYRLSDTGYDKLIIGDIHLYALNRCALSLLKSFGENLITTVPVELNKKELLGRNVKGEELIAYGRLPLMLSAQCVRHTLGLSREKASPSGDCPGTNRSLLSDRPDRSKERNKRNMPSLPYVFLKDRYSNEFPCSNLCGECTNVIYNSVPVFISEKDGIIDRLKPRFIRLDLTTETEEESVDIIKYYVNKNPNADPPVKKYTKGHLNRGVE